MKVGWTKNWRKKWDDPSLKGRPNHLLVWDWIISHAEWREEENRSKVRFAGNIITLNLGQLTSGSLIIAEYTGVAQSTVRRVINDLVNEQLIDQQIDNKCSLITVKNWKEYQSNEQQDDQQVSSGRAADDQQVSTNKESKKVITKESKKDDVSAVADVTPEVIFLEEARRLSVLFSSGLRQTNPAYQQKFPSDLECSAALDRWQKDFDKMIRIDKATEEQITFVLNWLFTNTGRDASFWRPNIQSAGKLREKFSTLVPIIKREHVVLSVNKIHSI